MRLAYLSGTEVPSQAASALHVVKMCDALARQGADTTLYAFAPQHAEADLATFYGSAPGFEHVALRSPRRRWGWGFNFARQVRAEQRRRPPSERASVCYGRHPHSLLWVSGVGLPFAYEVHSLPTSRVVWWLEQRLFRRRNLRALVCITHSLAAEYRARFDISSPVVVLPDASDPPQAGLAPQSPWPGRAGALQVGYVGHLYPGKGMERIVELAPALPEMDFHIVGGRAEDVRHWQQRSSAGNLYFHGFVQHQQLGAYYQRLDVALLPIQQQVLVADGRGEIGRWTSPLKAFEYMAHGIPVVVSDTPVLHEIFQNERNALLADPGSTQSWVSALRRLLAEPALRMRLATAAEQDFLALYSWDRRARQVIELLQ